MCAKPAVASLLLAVTLTTYVHAAQGEGSAGLAITAVLIDRDLNPRPLPKHPLLATVGLMLWDGRSRGTLMNVVRLVGHGKPVVVYVQPRRRFAEVRTQSELSILIDQLDRQAATRLRADAAAEGLGSGLAAHAALGFEARGGVVLSSGTARLPYLPEYRLFGEKRLLERVLVADPYDDGPEREAMLRALDRIFRGEARICR